MPEGPSIVIAKEKIAFLTGKTVTAVHGNTKIDLQKMEGQTVTAIKSWGKHLLISFEDFTLRIHFMMFGSYLVNEQKATPLRLGLIFGADELNLYTCSLLILEDDINKIYDWEEDVMADEWNAKKAFKKIKADAKAIAADVLLDQHLFSGSGNIIKNEVLYRTKIHPLCPTSALPDKKLKELIDETRNYSFDFLKWKKEYTLSKHWLAYKKKVCKRCDLPFTRTHLGKGNRLTFFCSNCQINYEI